MPPPYQRGLEVRVIGEIHGSACINVWHFGSNLQGWDDQNFLIGQLQQLAAAMLACAIDALLPAVSSDYELIRVEAKSIYPVLSDPMVATAPANSVGARGPASHSFAASLCNLRSGIGGRRGRGKKFLPPPAEDDITASAIDEDVLLLLTAFLLCVAGKFTGQNATEDFELVIYSKTDDQAIGADFNSSVRPVTQMSPVADVAIRSSRRKGRGA